MSKKSVNCASSGGAVGAEVKFAGNDSKNKMYKPKHKKKLVRVLTVIAYIFSVSLAAITLSLFYLFIYNPGKSGHSVGSSNISVNGKFYGRNIEGMLMTINNTYSNYEREEPRALPLKTLHQQQHLEHVETGANMSDIKPVTIPSKRNESSIGEGNQSFFTQLARTLSLTLLT